MNDFKNLLNNVKNSNASAIGTNKSDMVDVRSIDERYLISFLKGMGITLMTNDDGDVPATLLFPDKTEEEYFPDIIMVQFAVDKGARIRIVTWANEWRYIGSPQEKFRLINEENSYKGLSTVFFDEDEQEGKIMTETDVLLMGGAISKEYLKHVLMTSLILIKSRYFHIYDTYKKSEFVSSVFS